MSLRLGDIAPDFEQDSSEGRIRLHEWLGDSWGVLFSHPADFTPVCTTELGFTAKLKDQFAQRGVKVLALSVDPVESHLKWIDDINETQDTRVNFPIIADADRKVSELYDLIHPNANDTLTVRSLFIIDPSKKVRLIITYPASTGRNFNEILRVIDSLQLTDEHKVATPANWEDGDEVVIVPSLKDEEEIKRRFPKGYRAVKPYLRLTPSPTAEAGFVPPAWAGTAGGTFYSTVRAVMQRCLATSRVFGRFRPALFLCAPARRRDAFYPPSISETGSDLPARRGEGSLIHLLPGADA